MQGFFVELWQSKCRLWHDGSGCEVTTSPNTNKYHHHRDVKPDNFMVGGKNGQVVKLVDFGLSVPLPEKGKLGWRGSVGTAPYMCPEMLTGPGYDEKADVWSFGVVVYVLMFGGYPYVTREQKAKAMKQAIIDKVESPSFKSVQMGLDPAALVLSTTAASFVTILLSRDPKERPSADEALQMTWMRSSMQGTHMIGIDLPSRRPMLQSAHKLRAIKSQSLRDSGADEMLNMFRMQQQHPQGHRDDISRSAATTCSGTGVDLGSDRSEHSFAETALASNPGSIFQ